MKKLKLLAQLESAFASWKNDKLCLYINREDAVELLKHHDIILETPKLKSCPDCKNHPGACCSSKECTFVCDTCDGEAKVPA